MLGSLNSDPLSPTSPTCFGGGRALDWLHCWIDHQTLLQWSQAECFCSGYTGPTGLVLQFKSWRNECLGEQSQRLESAWTQQKMGSQP